MIDGSECGIVSHLQLIFGSLHYRETSGKFPKPLTKFCLPAMDPSRGKEVVARFIRKWYCDACLFMKRLPYRDSVAERVFLVT
ncbi:hypothetical protein CEXT_221361 [Caerostris extrusa]|uniref:Uncharacterized protein n=1 Tax=Caerostris extrusa TaxID=172846 RepID=A0AAV4U924_CAEEX|nr:hypothetical protein CEXT_221361 [Caerostris extrusa]